MKSSRRVIKWTMGIVGLGMLIPAVAEADQSAVQSSVVSADPVNVTPFILNGRGEALAKIGNRIYVGGSFTQLKNWQGSAPIQTRNYLFAYNATTGQVDTGFNPVINATVMTLASAPDGSGLYVGGQFSTVNGLARAGLVKLDPATGATIAAFKGTVGGGWVTDLDVANGKVYVIGSFSKVKGVARARLGAVDATTGAIDTDLFLPLGVWQTSGSLYMAEYHLDVSSDGARMMIVGNFGTVDGQPRVQAAQIDLSTSPDSLIDWHTNLYPFCTCLKTDVNDVEIDQTGTYAIIVAGWPPGWNGYTPTALGDHAARWEMSARGEVQPTWFTSTPYDTFTATAISSTAVYVGGHFRWLNGRTSFDSAGAVNRKGLGALDPETGVPMNWNPGRDRGWGVLDFLVTNDQLIIAHDTKNVGGEYHPKLAAFPLAGGSTPPPAQSPTLPTTLRVLPSSGTDVTTSSFDGTTVGAATVVATEDWTQVQGAFVNGNTLYAGSTDGKFYKYSWDGTTWVNPIDLSTRADSAGGQSIYFWEVGAMAYDGTGIFFTRTGQPGLWWSGFNRESGIIGGYQRVARATDFTGAVSMFVIDSTLYVAWGAGSAQPGDLMAMPLDGITPDWDARSTLSGPAVDGRDWSNGEVVPFAG